MAKDNLEEFAYKSIIQLIQQNHFKPGDALLETELSDMFGLKSRTPVRHALGQLVASGFLEKRKKKGCIIPVATPEDAHQVFFARECVEGNAAFSAAAHATKADVEDLRSIVEKESDTGSAGKKYDYSILNQRFHQAVARISRNKYFIQYSEHLFWRSQIYIFLFGGYYTQADYIPHMLSPPQHKNVLAAIEARDREKARELMSHHVRFTFDKISRIITEYQGQHLASCFDQGSTQ